MSSWLVYLVLMLDSINNMCLTIFIVLVILYVGILLLCLYVWMDDIPENVISRKNLIHKKVLLYILIFFFLYMFIPSTNQMAVIYLLPKIYNNQKLNKIPDKLIKFSNDYLDSKIKELESSN